MRKEVVIAVIIGLILGLSLTFGFYQMKKSSDTESTPTTDLEQFVGVSPTPEPTVTTKIAILAPEEGSILSEARTVISGSTIPNSYLVLFVNEEEFITTSDETGNFSFDVELENGSNLLIVHLLEDSGETYVAERVVIVSNALDQPAPTASVAAEKVEVSPTPSKVTTTKAPTKAVARPTVKPTTAP